jgi:hypothetical protein
MYMLVMRVKSHDFGDQGQRGISIQVNSNVPVFSAVVMLVYIKVINRNALSVWHCQRFIIIQLRVPTFDGDISSLDSPQPVLVPSTIPPERPYPALLFGPRI